VCCFWGESRRLGHIKTVKWQAYQADLQLQPGLEVQRRDNNTNMLAVAAEAVAEAAEGAVEGRRATCCGSTVNK